jgi:hypothetical protein
MMRGLGLAHFWVGWLYLFTSPRLRSATAIANLAAWTLAGAVLCWLALAGGGTKNPFFLMAFYAYFLIHEIRDEANLFVIHREAPDHPQRDRFLRQLAASVTVSLMTIFAALYVLHGRVGEKLETAVADAEVWLGVLIGALFAGCATSWWLTCRTVRRHGLDWRDYSPLLVVYAAIGLLLTIGSAFGSFGFNLIVLIHVCAWLVFTHQRLVASTAPPRRGWAWWRGTPAGFLTLHAGAALIVLVLMALRVHLWERAGWISVLFATSSFPYWSIMHITMAFWRGR